MTAVLSPAEHDETVRFGIQDDEAFEAIVENFEVIACVACGAEAALRLSMRCCDKSAVICGPCRDRHHEQWAVFVVVSPVVCCAYCRTIFGSNPAYEAVYVEVPL